MADDFPPVTEDDVRAAWAAMYEREPEWSHVPIKEPDPTNYLDRLTLNGLRRILEQDRARVEHRHT